MGSDGDLPDESVLVSLEATMEYLEGRLDLETAAERLGPKWGSANKTLRTLSNGPVLPGSDERIAAKWSALQRAWARRWPTDSQS